MGYLQMTRNVESIFGAVVTAPHQIPYTYTATGGEKFISLPFYPVTGIVTINGGLQVPLDNFEIDGNTLNLGCALSKGDVVFCLFDKILSPEDYKTGIRIYKFQAVGGETEFTPDYTSYGVQSLYIGGEYKTPEIEYSYDSTTGKVSLQTALTAGVWVVAEMSVKQPNISPLFDRSIQEIARSVNVKDSEVILSTDTVQSLNNKKVIYNPVNQQIYAIPELPTNVYISNVVGNILTYTPGDIQVTLLTPQEKFIDNLNDSMVVVKQPYQNAIPITQQEQNKYYVSALSYGVDPTFTLDSSDALQNALNDAYEQGYSQVMLPAGRFKMSKGIVIPAGVQLIGQGIDYWDTYRPSPDRLLKSWSKGSHLVFVGSGAKNKTFLNISNERPVKTVNGVDCKFTSFTNEDSVGTSPATPKSFSVAVSAVHASQIRNLRIMVSKNGIDGYNDAGSNTLGDEWDIGLHVYDSSDAVIDNVQIVGYWRVKGLLLTENDGSLSMKGNSEKTHFNNLYVQSGIGIRNSPQIDLISNTANSVTFTHRPSLRITAGNSFSIAGSADLRTFTGSTFDGTNVTLTGVTPPISGTIGVIRFPGLGNNFSGTVFENTVATTLDHTSGQPAESFGLPPSFALEVDGYPIRNLRFDKFKAQTTFDKGNTLWGDCRDIKLTSSEFENGLMVGYNLNQTQGYTGNIRFFACDLQTSVDTSGFTPRDAFVDNRQIKTDFTDGSFILKNWRATNTRLQWSTGQDALVLREAPTEVSVGGLYGYTLDGSRWLTVDGPTKDVTLLARNGSIHNVADNTPVMSWFGSSGNVSFKGIIAPMVDNSKSIGSASLRWSQVYAATGTINTSDGRYKTDITEIEESERRVAHKLKGMIRRFRFTDAVNDKGSQARWHFGVIAQEVQQAFADEGLDAHEYGLFCHDTWETEYVPVMATKTVIDDETGIESEVLYDTGEKKVLIEGGDRYGIRYEELLCFIIAAI